MANVRTIVAVPILALAILGCGSAADETGGSDPSDARERSPTAIDGAIARDPDVPDLPFPDNPDPDACGIPRPWGDDGTAWLSGVWEGELIEPRVLLYDSHLRKSITGSAPHGSAVRIVLFQENPTLDYYFVEVVDDPSQDGWVPAPFLSFDPID